VTSEAHSYRINSVTTPLNDEKSVTTFVDMDFAAPDSYHERGGCPSCGEDNWYEFVFIGDEKYYRDGMTPEWCKLPCADNALSVEFLQKISPQKRLADILEPLNWLVNLQKLPDEAANGFDCWHYVGTVDNSYMNKKTTVEGMRCGMMVVELWVGKDTYLVRQIRDMECYTGVNVAMGEVKSYSGAVTTQFHDYNESIIIEVPIIESFVSTGSVERPLGGG